MKIRIIISIFLMSSLYFLFQNCSKSNGSNNNGNSADLNNNTLQTVDDTAQLKLEGFLNQNIEYSSKSTDNFTRFCKLGSNSSLYCSMGITQSNPDKVFNTFNFEIKNYSDSTKRYTLTGSSSTIYGNAYFTEEASDSLISVYTIHRVSSCIIDINHVAARFSGNFNCVNLLNNISTSAYINISGSFSLQEMN